MLDAQNSGTPISFFAAKVYGKRCTDSRRIAGQNYLREWRQHRGLSQIQVQRRFGWSEGRISKLESGVVPAKQPVLSELARLYGCEVGDLFAPPPAATRGGLQGVLELRRRIARLQHDVTRMKEALGPLFAAIERQLAEAGKISETAAKDAEELAKLFTRYAAEMPRNDPNDEPGT